MADVNEQRHESRTTSKLLRFVRDVGTVGRWSEDEAMRNCVVVLAHLEQRLTGDQTRRFEAQLPLKLREILAEVPKSPPGKPGARFHRDDFIERVGADLGVQKEEAEAIVRAVFTAVRSHITDGEAWAVEDELPRDMKHLWAMPL